jgi:hypothetical protein
MVKVLNWIGILSGAGAAMFWLWSAMLPIPKIDLQWNGEASLFLAALKRQSELSAAAAVCAAVSVFSQAILLTRRTSR